jgi:hypothetical protein
MQRLSEFLEVLADDFLTRAQERFSQRTNAGLLAWTFAGRSR